MNYIDYNSDGRALIITLLIVFALLVGMTVGLVIATDGERVRREAVKAGVAYYQSNTNTGEAVFTWKSGCE